MATVTVSPHCLRTVKLTAIDSLRPISETFHLLEQCHFVLLLLYLLGMVTEINPSR